MERLIGDVAKEPDKNAKLQFAPQISLLFCKKILTTMRQICAKIFLEKYTFQFCLAESWFLEERLGENEFHRNETFVMVAGRNNSDILVDQLGFRYRRGHRNKREDSNVQYWKCSKLNKTQCKAYVKVKGDLIVLQRYEHNHNVDV